MASTTHTMSILVRQMVARLSAESKSGTDWFPDPKDPCGVVGSLLTFVLDRSSEVLESFISGGLFSDVPKLLLTELVPVSVTPLMEEKGSLVPLAGIFVPPNVFAKLPLLVMLAGTVVKVTPFDSECLVALGGEYVDRLADCRCGSGLLSRNMGPLV